MEDNIFDSLQNKLIKSGILNEGNELEENYGIVLDDDMSNSPFIENPIKETAEYNLSKKRINEYDMNLLDDKSKKKTTSRSYEIIRRLLNFKENRFLNKKTFTFEGFFFAFFPKIYKAKIAKEALKKIHSLNIDAKILLDKTIPYGEEEMRYKSLIKYINFANEIQNSVKRKCE